MYRTLEPARRKLDRFRWIEPQRWHITLKFYGDITPAQAKLLGQGLETLKTRPIPIELRGLGAFPDLRSPRVLWVGVLNTTPLLRDLSREVNQLATAHGIAVDMRKYRPHLTVARALSGGSHRPVARELTPWMDTSLAHTTLSKITLYENVMGEDGPEYVALNTVDLTKNDS